MKCLLILPQSGASQTLWLPAAHLHNALLATLFDCFSHNATNFRNSWSSFLSPLFFFSHFLLSFIFLIFFNNSHLYNYVLAIFWLQRNERRLRFFVQQIYLFDKMKYNKARQNHTFCQASPLKCAVRIFRMSEVKRANEGKKRGVVTTLS